MGQLLSSASKMWNKQYKVIYIQDANEKFYPLKWPDTYSELLLALKVSFNYYPKNDVIIVDDVSEHPMSINSQQSFQALIPKHK
jgi:hypothetical protein